MPSSSVDIITKAKSYIGVTELPPNSNNVIFNTHYYGKEVNGSSYPWCAVFLWDVFRMCNASDLFYGGKKCAYTPTLANYYKSINRWYATPKIGDLVFYQFAGSSRINHVGIVIDVLSNTKIRTIEGNTGSGNDANGGAVQIRDRVTTYVKGYGRPDYSDTKTATDNGYSYLQFVKDVQKIIGVKVDGAAGPITLSKTPTISKNTNNKHAVIIPIKKYLKASGYNIKNEDAVYDDNFEKVLKEYQSQWTKKPDGIIDAKAKTWKMLLKINT